MREVDFVKWNSVYLKYYPGHLESSFANLAENFLLEGGKFCIQDSKLCEKSRNFVMKSVSLKRFSRTPYISFFCSSSEAIKKNKISEKSHFSSGVQFWQDVWESFNKWTDRNNFDEHAEKKPSTKRPSSVQAKSEKDRKYNSKRKISKSMYSTEK